MMRVAFVFPGQGSQKIGMGKDLADNFVEARRVFEEVDSALSQKLSDIMWNGSQEELTQTENAQPALMAVSMAALRSLESCGFSFENQKSFLAGHSLGEYAALAAAGVFSLSDTARILRIRGKAMESSFPHGKGGMAAVIGLSAVVVEDICQQIGSGCQIANDNGASQFVLSGLSQDIDHAMVMCLEKGAKRCVRLSVSSPFHSSFMESAVVILEEALGKVEKKTPLLPVIANVTVQPMWSVDEIVSNLLHQITGRVRWRETVEWLVQEAKITLCCEIGSGNVLSALFRRMNPSLETMKIEKCSDIDAACILFGSKSV